MMLYEAVHFQRSENYLDYPSKMKETKPKVQRTRSTGSVQRAVTGQALSRTASFVIGQKLRESKWFKHDELRVFCAVIETGFIVQSKDESDKIEFGIAVWNAGQEKSKNPDFLKVYSVCSHKDNFRMMSYELLSFWPEGTKIRIFNQSDKTDMPHSEEVIRDQIAFAETAKQKWHGSEHFTYWCRYGPIQINQRVRNMTDTRWGNFGINALKNRIRRITHSK